MNREYFEKDYDFLTAKAGDRFDIGGYKYMDIIVDGAINPRANVEEDYLFVDFNNKFRLLIDQEVRNVDIGQYDFADFTNAAHGTPRDLENGYGKLYFILKRSMFVEVKKLKHNPSFEESVVVATGTTEHLWLGVDRPVAGYTLAIPFIPRGYARICVIGKAALAIVYATTLDGYYNEPSTESVQMATTPNANFDQQLLNSFSRFSIAMTQTDGTDRTFHVHSQLTDRG